jgi:multimeric flavodoxin WrbA
MPDDTRGDGGMHVLILAASPRVDGNSRALATALMQGAQAAGHTAGLVDLNEVMTGGFLRDCRRCRRPDGMCSIEDGYYRLLRHEIAAADALVYATPLYWYGIAAVLKNFFDRMVCFVSGSFPQSEEMVAALTGKRVALLLASEERYPGASIGVLAQIQELSRYLRHEFVGVVNGVGNKRGEVACDPSDPLTAAAELGRRLFDLRYSDFRIDTERPNAVWTQAATGDDGAATGVYEDV